MSSNYAALSREELAGLMPELLLSGQLIDRSGMAWCIGAWGRDEMAAVAIDEWMAASPIYTRRMQRALGYEGDDVVTIFKGLQLDIGAPPQFLDFRFALDNRWSGRFWLDHCGALCDVQPLGEDHVQAMCHDIEDPTFDATAVATNRRAQIRPVHRPPGVPESGPVCEWTVIISPDHEPVADHPSLAAIAATNAAQLTLDPVDPTDAGRSAYDGDLLSDVDFASFSHSALVRMADEIALQSHLLNLSFVHAVRARGGGDELLEKQLVGWAGATALRLRRFLGVGATVEQVRAIHPLFNPAAYVDSGLAAADDGWHALDLARASRAIEVAVIGEGEQESEVAVVEFSTGLDFGFEQRRSLPITPV